MSEIIQPYSKVALIGRTNVGKSTLFNRLTEGRQALVSTIPGTTRDYRYGDCFWHGQTVTFIDTAGLDVESEKTIDLESIKNVKKAMKEASVLLFIVDAHTGITPADREILKQLRQTQKPILLVVNKVDSKKYLHETPAFYKLGFKNIHLVSARTGSGAGDLIDAVLETIGKDLKEEVPTPEDIKKINIVLLGKPNVGKSSLLNKIIGEEKAIVSPIPHTTRDSQDITISYEKDAKNYWLTFVDTAGMIKQRKIANQLQEISIEQSIENLKRSDICLILIDASEPISMQDKNISREILENNKSIIFVVNKWDLYPDKDTNSDKTFTLYLHRNFPYLTWAPVVFISAKTGFKVNHLVDMVIDIHESQTQEITQNKLDDFRKFLVRKQPPRQASGVQQPYIHKIKQVGTKPLTFEIIADGSKNIHFAYRRYITNELRDHFKFRGCGIKLRLTEPRRGEQSDLDPDAKIRPMSGPRRKKLKE
jgi:GTP-binding protein